MVGQEDEAERHCHGGLYHSVSQHFHEWSTESVADIAQILCGNNCSDDCREDQQRQRSWALALLLPLLVFLGSSKSGHEPTHPKRGGTDKEIRSGGDELHRLGGWQRCW